MTAAIEARALGKRYRLGHFESGYQLLTERIAQRLRRGPRPAAKEADFWALRDVSFSIEQGETVGILGRNGAGKSTLLKLLSRVTLPTSGSAQIEGRVGSLLEVGTGFHPELSGRENVFLNGAVLGMQRREIARQFDEIVDFAGVERFLDTPVKRYSSGMYLRLAFSVAAHLDPEILLVDEVLAVGDAAFQRKCLGKMRDVAGGGRTVIFVSHNTAAVENLCRRGLVLEQGRLVFDGPAADSITHYMNKVVASQVGTSLAARTDRRGNGAARFTSFEVQDAHGRPVVGPRSGEPCVLSFGYESAGGEPLRNVVASFAISTLTGTSLILHRTNFTNQDFDSAPGRGRILCEIPEWPLAQGQYLIGVMLQVQGEVADDPGVIAELEVEAGDFFGTGSAGVPAHSPVLMKGSWALAQG